MHLTFFGGTGPTGRLLIDDALAAGHTVTAFACTLGTLPTRGQLDLAAGQLADAPAAETAIGEIVRDSGLQWTFVRVPFLTNGPRTNNLNVRMKGEKGGMRVSRANVAAFLLEPARDKSRIGAAPYITDK